MTALIVFTTKLILLFLRLTDTGGGTALPGLVALKLYPNILPKLTRQFRRGVVFITGTNGKTTTSKLINTILLASGSKVIYNRSGSNLTRGIVSTLIEQASLLGRINADYGLFEVDEATMPEAVLKVSPTIVVVLNLFRDQLDRYGELDATARLIGSSLKTLDKKTVILNADDPLVAALAASVPHGRIEQLGESVSRRRNELRFFGINDRSLDAGATEQTIDTKECLYDGETLVFEARYFGHLGIYHCPKNNLVRPEPDVAAESVTLHGVEGSTTAVSSPAGAMTIELKLPGLHTVYNALAAISVAQALSVPNETIVRAVTEFTSAFGRMERVAVREKTLYLLLTKNPMSFTQTLRTFTADGTPKKLLLALNDNFADGTDISWIWDVEFELLRTVPHTITVSGARAHELALRLKYAGITQNVTIIPSLEGALTHLLSAAKPDELVYVIPTYTAMMALRQAIQKLDPTLKAFWEEATT